MINKLNINNVASYKNHTTLVTDKKVNLIYGLNGTGKTTISNLLYKPHEASYKDCSIDGLNEDDDIIVYNQTFIYENFYESEDLNGIFSLSSQNKEVITQITKTEEEVKKLTANKTILEEKINKELRDLEKIKKSTKDKIWEIKKNYTGGDRVLEFCLDGFKSDGNKLLSHVISLKLPESKPSKSIDDIKNKVLTLSGENAQKYSLLPLFTFNAKDIELDSIFKKEIIGNNNSSVSELINKLGNSDWVKEGLSFISENDETCPFCQEKSISTKLLKSIKDYFDESYENDLKSISDLLKLYSETFDDLPQKAQYVSCPLFKDYKKDFEIKYSNFSSIFYSNKLKIENKLKSPSLTVTLQETATIVIDLNNLISEINKLIVEHNNNIDQKDRVLRELKGIFWENIRRNYDQIINHFLSSRNTSNTNITSIEKSIEENSTKRIELDKRIKELQKQTVNIEDAIESINNGLINLGIVDFKIKNHSKNLYKIVRGDNESKIFHSLSEGEKMIISFLYFIELCRGRKNSTETVKNKIVVIDDPISSLSHIYVFNIGRLIHNEFLRNDKYKQIIILTHSLYFFYELTDTNHERRKENQKLFRLRKNENGSQIFDMKYDEIQNDYHSYWFIVKDDEQPPALIANCMRNIIEYFFNFVEKKDLSAFIQKKEMQANRFQAFCRYINRESHSLGQNIFDIKEFNYKDFKDAFACLFQVTGYKEHYKKMIK